MGRIVRFLSLLVLALSLPLAAAPVEWKFVSISPSGQIFAKVFEELAQEITSKTNGQVKVTFYPAGELPYKTRSTKEWVNKAVHPGLLIAGMNCVCTDAVATAVMGFDPMADRGTPPFEKCDSTLHLSESLGVGTRDLKRIEVVGTPIEKARYKFPALSSLAT